MTIGFSTSSPWASVAAIEAGDVLWQGRQVAAHNAAGACLELLQRLLDEAGVKLPEVDLFAADMGPGSFTGVRVGVTLAKSFGYLYERPVAGLPSFDLIAPARTVVLPSKKGEYFVRRPGDAPIRSPDLPEEAFVGYGPGIESETHPDASRFAEAGSRLVPQDVWSFAPEYLVEPGISIPKKPYGPKAGQRV